jgi:peptidoglycan L-alanyl-D-glutamate endopeptidase CwlK|tara:strand:- start:3639 stop:4061 length:423 start_codon:yes stop_codon:yes gene_type:complete
MFKLSERSKQRREGVDPRLIEIDDLAIQITLVDYGHPADAGLRTAERQNELFQNGKSQCDGYDSRSCHQSGMALDFYAYVDGKASWDKSHLAMVACAYLQAASQLGYKIRWGGLWKSKSAKAVNGIKYGWDCPHIQLDED